MQINLTTEQCNAIMDAIARQLREGATWEYRANTLLVAHDRLLRAVATAQREKRERYRKKATTKRIAAVAPTPVPEAWRNSKWLADRERLAREKLEMLARERQAREKA